MPHTTATGPVDHPGTPVPSHLRSWDRPWPGYTPVDITPPELRPAALTEPEHWITDTGATPEGIDWERRQINALVAFRLDADGYPLNPTGRTGRTGRNLGKWGESQAADPVVIAGTGDERRILLIQRDDIGVWALPGGMVDPGETAPAALVRELQEETGVDLSHQEPDDILTTGVVADWRNTDHAWVASTAALYTLPTTVTATAADDAADAAWWPFHSVEQLAALLEDRGGLYDAHRHILTAAETATR
jgi:ADP-ribose pyrophosphatase